ncbi:MAG: dihydrodipicolinate synthase family protein [Chitinophagaceae bacterium]|nr:dihydrodipicolinate synthase family protein [Chitinophagaceae bacterium]MCW5926237.1 dihydrodipicolinate synthase family protein [Chitinophagaceae bacterium]
MSRKFVPVMITPFTPQAQIDYEMLKRLIDFYLAAGVKGLFANCLSSEMYSISDDERIELTRAVVKHVNGRVPIVATGSFGETIKDKAEFTKRIHDTGIDSVVLITSHYAKVEEPDDVLLKNFDTMLKLTGNIPLGLYECPAPYKRLVSPKVLKTLVSTGRMFYHKDTCCNEQQVKEKLEILKGSSMQFYDAHTPHGVSSMKAGADGMSAISGNFYPEILVWLCENVDDAGKQEQVNWIQEELTKVDPLIHHAYPMSSKFFLQLRGLPIHTISRAHPLEATPQQKATLHKIFDTTKTWFEKLKLKEVLYEDMVS